MSTTTIRLPDDLKSRVAKAADRAGTTPHAFMLDAIAERVTEDEHRNAFYATAEERYARIVDSGAAVPWSQMKTYLQKRITGEATPEPVTKKLGS